MKPAAPSGQVLNRLKAGAKAGSDTELAVMLGVTQQSVSSARSKGKVPDAWIRIAAERFNLSADWLLFGAGPTYRDEGTPSPERLPAPSPPPVIGGCAEPPLVKREIPVLGPASCGPADWLAPAPLAFRLHLAGDYAYNPELFAVVAMGCGMEPEGIHQGFVLFCDPRAELVPGDAVFVEKTDGTAALRRFARPVEQRIVLQCWHPPKEDGTREIYTEELSTAVLKRIACVVVVRRKA